MEMMCVDRSCRHLSYPYFVSSPLRIRPIPCAWGSKFLFPRTHVVITLFQFDFLYVHVCFLVVFVATETTQMVIGIGEEGALARTLDPVTGAVRLPLGLHKVLAGACVCLFLRECLDSIIHICFGISISTGGWM